MKATDRIRRHADAAVVCIIVTALLTLLAWAMFRWERKSQEIARAMVECYNPSHARHTDITATNH